MSSPRYFFAVFGNPSPPSKDTVESGIYHPHPKFAPFEPRPGDFLLLYCTNGYVRYAKSSPGYGVVVRHDDLTIEYDYHPFPKPFPIKDIRNAFRADDKAKLRNIRFSSHWLFELNKNSFLKAKEFG
ncbi:MAG: hypothetical protein A4E69_02981 [Syntrophus sp. PtaB.Bin138]|jgi:hypothetical protein|nr:MAG: hypothetical protein A4E69_02981 [Syntrophus sp. PtaB.Bin138]